MDQGHQSKTRGDKINGERCKQLYAKPEHFVKEQLINPVADWLPAPRGIQMALTDTVTSPMMENCWRESLAPASHSACGPRSGPGGGARASTHIQYRRMRSLGHFRPVGITRAGCRTSVGDGGARITAPAALAPRGIRNHQRGECPQDVSERQ